MLPYYTYSRLTSKHIKLTMGSIQLKNIYECRMIFDIFYIQNKCNEFYIYEIASMFLMTCSYSIFEPKCIHIIMLFESWIWPHIILFMFNNEAIYLKYNTKEQSDSDWNYRSKFVGACVSQYPCLTT